MKIKYLLNIILFQLILSYICLAQWSTDPAQNLRVTTMGLSPKMVSDGAGGAYILYKDMPLDLVHLYVQRLDKYGYRKFPGNGVMISDSSRYQGHIYFLINDQNGGTIIAFTDEYFLDELGNIAVSVFVQRIDSVGNKLWGETGIIVDLYEKAELTPVSLTADSEGGCYVFWGVRHDRNNKELRAQHLDSSGNFLCDSSGVLISDQFVSYSSAIPCLSVIDQVGGTICHYYDSTGAKLQRIDSSNNLLWGDGVSPFSDYWWDTIKADGSGGVIIAGSYETFYDEINELWNHNIGAQRIDKDGDILWGENGIILKDSVNHRTWPELAIDISGNCTILWRDSRTGVSNVYLQKVNQQGELIWKNGGIPVSIVKSMKWNVDSGINLNKLGGVVVMWNDKRTGEKTLYGQSIDSYGDYLWFEDVLISSRLKMSDAKMISDLKGGAIVCWYETPPEVGIHTQQVSLNGNLGEVLITNIRANNLKTEPQFIQLFQNYPNPFNFETAIKYQLSRLSLVKIIVYDINGKEVIKLVNKRQESGTYRILWDGKNKEGCGLSSGIYIIRLQADESIEVIKTILIK